MLLLLMWVNVKLFYDKELRSKIYCSGTPMVPLE